MIFRVAPEFNPERIRSGTSARFVTVAIAFLTVTLASAQTTQQALTQMRIDQKLGAQVPSNVPFKDEHGNRLLFGELFGKRPIIFLPIFYTCAGVCAKEADSVVTSIIRFNAGTVGKDFDVVFLSINPKETPELALSKKNAIVGLYARPGSDNGFHFLTGSLDEIHQITDSVGFHFTYDAVNNRVNHPAGIMVLTPQGKVSQYLFGDEYASRWLESSLTQAKKEGIGQKAEFIALGCIMIDPQTGRRSLVIENVIRLIAGVCALCLFTWIGVMSYRGRLRPGGVL